MELSEKDEEYISYLVKQGKKVEAIAFVKDKTGMSLIEAKDYIDKKNISISEEDEQYLSSLINENKELEAVIFLHKNKDMSLLEAKNYTDRLILKKNIETNKRTTRKWGYVYDEELSTFVPNLARQKKALKIMKSIFWIFLLIFLIQLIFWDRSSDIKMITFRFSISGILVLIITLPLGSLSIHYIENKLKKLKNLELSNQFENRGITLLYDKDEIKSIKFEKINFIKFYAKKFKRGENNIPSIEIFDMEKNIFTELDIKISDYILLKMYFEKYKVLVKDEFKKI